MKKAPGRSWIKALCLLAGLCIISSLAAVPGLAGTAAPGSIYPDRYSFFQTLNEQDRNGFRPEITPADSGGPPIQKSYLVPALEVVGFLAVMNGIARLAYPDEISRNGKDTYRTDPSTFWHNLTDGNWRIDNDDFMTNQFQHPYLGATYHGFARSAGVNYWEAMGYTIFGSVLWSTAGETGTPSINDQVASGISGNFLGEPLFRMANLLLENTRPGFWRKLGSALISPPAAINRHAFGDRFKAVFPSYKPATFWHFDVGPNVNIHRSGPGTDFHRGGTVVSFSMEYGLPGKPGYSYTRPFDYFAFEAGAASNYSNGYGILCARGLLAGKKYSMGDAYRGVWGLYGSYDYISTDPARISITGLSVGTTAQWWISPGVALQGTLLGGIGYGAGGELSGVPNRTYHYGGTAQGGLDLRLILHDLVMLDLKGREYYLSDVASSAPQGSENITRLRLGLTVRVRDRHAVGLHYQFSQRNTHYRGIGNMDQETGMISLVYSFLNGEGFGAVDFSGLPLRQQH